MHEANTPVRIIDTHYLHQMSSHACECSVEGNIQASSALYNVILSDILISLLQK